MNMDTPKVLHMPRKMKVIFWKPCKSIAPVTQNSFADTRECHDVPRLPRKTTSNLFGHLRKWEVLQLPPWTRRRYIDMATLEDNQRIETRHVGISKRAFRARLPSIALHYITCIYWRYMHTCLHAYIRTYTLWMLYHGFVDEALSVTIAGSLHCPESPRPTKAAHLPPNGNRVPAGSKETSGSPRTYSSLLATGLRIGDSRVVIILFVADDGQKQKKYWKLQRWFHLAASMAAWLPRIGMLWRRWKAICPTRSWAGHRGLRGTQNRL